VDSRTGIVFFSLHFYAPHFSANVFLPAIRQKHVDDGSGRKMIGRNIRIKNLQKMMFSLNKIARLENQDFIGLGRDII
jgi:hypothetical protein